MAKIWGVDPVMHDSDAAQLDGVPTNGVPTDEVPTDRARLGGLREALTGEMSRLRRPRRPSRVQLQRKWLFPGADELFRGIYTRSGTDSPETLAVCSAIAAEGRTTISVGLGVTIAQDFPERRVTVVETDLSRPVLAKDFNVQPKPGLVDCLLSNQPVRDACRDTALHNFQVVPAGGPVTDAGRVLCSSRMVAAVEALRQSHDLVILDLPAVLVNSDAQLLTDLVDGVIFVVQAGVTPASLVKKAIGQIDETKLRGVVLNDVHSAVPGWLRRLCGL